MFRPQNTGCYRPGTPATGRTCSGLTETRSGRQWAARSGFGRSTCRTYYRRSARGTSSANCTATIQTPYQTRTYTALFIHSLKSAWVMETTGERYCNRMSNPVGNAEDPSRQPWHTPLNYDPDTMPPIMPSADNSPGTQKPTYSPQSPLGSPTYRPSSPVHTPPNNNLLTKEDVDRIGQVLHEYRTQIDTANPPTNMVAPTGDDDDDVFEPDYEDIESDNGSHKK